MKNVVGVDVGGTKMYMVARVENEYVERKVPTGMTCTKEYIKAQLDDFISTLPYKVEGVGVALPGLVVDDCLVISDVVPNLNGVEANYFSEGQFIVKFINDVKAATLCEMNHYESAHTLAVMMVGTGIALGIASEGHILQGANGFAGELGNTYIPYKEQLLTFDHICGGAAILKKAGCTAEALIEKLNNEDQDAVALIKEAGHYFGMALGIIIQLYNPDVIVVGGSTSQYRYFLETAMETAKKYTLPELFEGVKFTAPQDPMRLVALGAAQCVK